MEVINNTQSASAVLALRDQMRQVNSGFLVRSPIPIPLYRHARLVQNDPSSTHRFPSPELIAMRQWLDATRAAGGTRADLFKCWQAWETIFPQQKSVLIDHFEKLCREADLEALQLNGAASAETRLENHVGIYKSKLDIAQRDEREQRRELAKCVEATKAAQQQLADAERALRESKQ